MSSDIPLPPSGCTSREALAKQHAAEVARADAKIAQMSKPKLGMKPIPSASIQLQAAAIREELKAKHEAELTQLEKYLEHVAAHPPAPLETPSAPAVAADDAREDDSDGEDDGTPGEGKKTKAQRRREKKKELAAVLVARVAGPDGTDRKEEELKALEKQVQPLGFKIKPIASDGNCMFRYNVLLQAVADQLDALGIGSDKLDYKELRRMTAQYIRMHPEEFSAFLPYLPEDAYPEDGNPAAAARALERYCERLERTSCWGGHPELRALAGILKLPIVVFQAESKPWEFTPTAESMSTAKTKSNDFAVHLSFHKNYYVLGEHYNSVVPK